MDTLIGQNNEIVAIKHVVLESGVWTQNVPKMLLWPRGSVQTPLREFAPLSITPLI